MKGIDWSEKVYRELVSPAIEKDLPEVLPILAAGLAGEGSECFGYDDEISQDHDSEIRICIWLPDEELERWKRPLEELLETLPDQIEGRAIQYRQFRRSGVFGIREFYGMLTGYENGPVTPEEWTKTEMPCLAAAVNGAVFADHRKEAEQESQTFAGHREEAGRESQSFAGHREEAGRESQSFAGHREEAGRKSQSFAGHREKTGPESLSFSAIRERLMRYYPRDVLLMKAARSAALAAQTGQYNYIRAMRRRDHVAAGVMKAYFAEQITALLFLLNRRYMPFYKWAYRSLEDLPENGAAVHGLLDTLFQSSADEAQPVIEEICETAAQMLRQQGLSDSDSSFLMDHVDSIMRKVADPQLRQKGISLVR